MTALGRVFLLRHGETEWSVSSRARAALPDGDVVLVGHGHRSRVLIARWIGLPAAEGARFRMDAAAWSVLGDERGEATP